MISSVDKQISGWQVVRPKEWPISVAVSTPPSHGGDSGSSPGSATYDREYSSEKAGLKNQVGLFRTNIIEAGWIVGTDGE